MTKSYKFYPIDVPEEHSFLTKAGYNLWKTEEDEYGIKYLYQSRIDNRDNFDESIPLCQCNDKLCINVDIHDWMVNRHQIKGVEIELCHENQFGEWTSTKIYSLTEADLEAKLHSLEAKLLRMWKEFNRE